MDSHPPSISSIDPGAQSGHETQYLFSDGDVRESYADALTVQPVVGKFISRSIKFFVTNTTFS